MLGVLALTGCGASKSSSSLIEFSNCAPPRYTVHAGVKTFNLGSCAGTLNLNPAQITVREGQTFSVAMREELQGRPLGPAPTPTGSAVHIVGRHDATILYAAKSVGASVLIARRAGCESTYPESRPHVGSCTAVLRVRVTP